MERLFHSFNGHIETRLQGTPPSEEQKRVLSYLIKSEWANEKLGYTILLTPDNNHFAALLALESAGLISKHSISTASYPVYIADRVLMSHGYIPELRQLFGSSFDTLEPFLKSLLGIVYRFSNYNKAQLVSAKQASFVLWYEGGGTSGGIEQFDVFYRRVRYAFNKLLKGDFVVRAEGVRGYRLNTRYLSTHLGV
jgi:hypothetical protein